MVSPELRYSPRPKPTDSQETKVQTRDTKGKKRRKVPLLGSLTPQPFPITNSIRNLIPPKPIPTDLHYLFKFQKSLNLNQMWRDSQFEGEYRESPERGRRNYSGSSSIRPQSERDRWRFCMRWWRGDPWCWRSSAERRRMRARSRGKFSRKFRGTTIAMFPTLKIAIFFMWSAPMASPFSAWPTTPPEVRFFFVFSFDLWICFVF